MNLIFGPTGSGSYNLIGLDGDSFWLQGNGTLEQLKQLRDELDKVIKEAKDA